MGQNTLIYAFPMEVSVTPDATYKTWNAETITIPETAGRVFKSAILEIAAQDVITATGGTIATFRIGVSVAGAPFTEVSDTSSISNTGENISVIMSADFVQQFIDNFGAGTTQDVAVRAYFDQTTGTTLGMINLTAILYITYEYTGVPAIRAKTVIIPLESIPDGLENVLTEIGTDQIPVLTGANGFIKEASPSILDYFFVIEVNENYGGGTDFSIYVALEDDVEYAFGGIERALTSERFDRFVWYRKTSIPDTSIAHKFKARINVLTNACKYFSIKLVVTYSYDEANTTKVTNSCWIPVHMFAPVSQDVPSRSMDFYIEEPGNIELLQSGIQLFWNMWQSLGSNFLKVKVGTQALRDYGSSIISQTSCGIYCLQQRFDSGSSMGAGLVLARGKNTIEVGFNSALGPNYVQTISFMIYLNYASDKASGGTPVHNHTIIQGMINQVTEVNTVTTTTISKAFTFPESEFWINSVGFVAFEVVIASPNISLFVDVPRRELGVAMALAYAEVQCGEYLFDSTKEFIRHPEDPDSNRLDFSSKLYGLQHGAGCGCSRSLMSYITYHAISFNISGSLVGYLGDGAGLIVDVRKDDGIKEKLYEFLTSLGGVWSGTVYDNTEYLVADVRQDNQRFGRSNRGIPS